MANDRHFKLQLIDCLRATRWTPADYWQTDNSNGLVMVIRNYHSLNSASRVLKSTCSAPLVQMGERKQFSLIDLDLWPTTYDLDLQPQAAKVKIDPHAKNQGHRSNGSNRRAPADKRTDTHTHTHTDATKRIVAPATRSIKIEKKLQYLSNGLTDFDEIDMVMLCMKVMNADWYHLHSLH